MNDIERDTLTASGRVLGFCFVLAWIAGLFSALAKQLRLRDALIAAGVSGVGGAVVGAICVALWGADRWYWTCAVCGLAGWAGGNLILDRLTFVAWTIAKGRVPAIGERPCNRDVPRLEPQTRPEAKEVARDQTPAPSVPPDVDPLQDLDVPPGGDGDRRL
ncbi:MAG TPA: hypothetical protein VNL70_08070 [Tepidisphaeraceae bacterium]|nr:hypothetical protein [Tepidisphaeraceae bacterium]